MLRRNSASNAALFSINSLSWTGMAIISPAPSFISALHRASRVLTVPFCAGTSEHCSASFISLPPEKSHVTNAAMSLLLRLPPAVTARPTASPSIPPPLSADSGGTG